MVGVVLGVVIFHEEGRALDAVVVPLAFFQAALHNQKVVEVDSENWEEGRPRLYRIKLKTRDVFRIVINATLYDIEHKNITDPMTFGAWKADMRNRGLLEVQDLASVEITAPEVNALQNFKDARRHLFNRFQDKDPAGVVEVLDMCAARRFSAKADDILRHKRQGWVLSSFAASNGRHDATRGRLR